MSSLKYRTTYQSELSLKASDSSYAKNIHQKHANPTHYGSIKKQNGDKSISKNEQYAASDNKKAKPSQLLSGNKESSHLGQNQFYQSTLKPGNISIQYNSSYQPSQNYNREYSSSKRQNNSKGKNLVQKQQSQHMNNRKPNNHTSCKVLSQHNSVSASYSSSLFPQSESIKEKLKQNVQQEMLNNYYINKYETLMNKISKEKIRIDQADENEYLENGEENQFITQIHSDQIQKSQQRDMNNAKKRKNFKQVMRKKHQKNQTNLIRPFDPQNQPNYNKNQFPNYYDGNTKIKNQIRPFQTQKNQQTTNQKDNQFLTVTFSPSKRINLHINHDSQPNHHKRQQNNLKSKIKQSRQSNSQSKGQIYKSVSDKSSKNNNSDSIPKSINRKKSNQNRTTSKNRSNYHSIGKNVNSKLQIEYRSNNLLLKKPNNTLPPHPENPFNPSINNTDPFNFLIQSTGKPHSSQHLSSHYTNQPSNSASYSPQKSYHSSQPHNSHQYSESPLRRNFKQSLKQKKSLYVEYESNLNLYKQLQSSIINELYSPSPKKIQKKRYDQIQLFNRQLSREELEQIQKDYLVFDNSNNSQSSRNKMKNYNIYNRHNIQINEDQLQLEQIQRQYNQRQYQRQGHSHEQIKHLDKLRQNIRSSLHSHNSSTLQNQPYQQYQSPEHNEQLKSSPSVKAPLESPKRSLISDQYKSKNSESSDNQDKWNPYFSNSNRHNKKLLISESSPIKKRIDMIAPIRKLSPQRPQRRYYSLEKTSPNIKKTIQTIKRVAENQQRRNKHSLRIQIKEQEQLQSDLQPSKANPNSNNHNHNKYPQNKKYETKSQVNDKFYNNPSIKTQKTKRTHQRKDSLNSIKSSPKPQPQSRYINENNNSQKNSLKDEARSPSVQQEDDDIEFIPPADEALFDSRSSNNRSQQSVFNSRKNHIQTIGQTRSRKASDQLSFISDSISFNEMSMLSRFSMTSEEGSMIIHKLDNEITQNEFGPYQNALQSLRDLLNENKAAWPIYVVGQKILDDRTEYEKKIQLQKSMLEDYKQKIIKMKQLNDFQAKSEQNEIRKNQLEILRLIRQLSSVG